MESPAIQDSGLVFLHSMYSPCLRQCRVVCNPFGRRLPLNCPPFSATSPRLAFSRSCRHFSSRTRFGREAYRCVCWSPCFCAATSCSHPQPVGSKTFPYKTSVAADDVYVRSGPGQNYYPTDKLKRGQEVEVYRHDPGGWCAIRPVDGSFTWVSGRFLKPTEDNLAVVTEDGVSARVGSRFSDIREVVQVRLQKGEVVEILERAAARQPAGAQGVVQDCPALGRVPLGVGQVSRCRLSPRRRAKGAAAGEARHIGMIARGRRDGRCGRRRVAADHPRRRDARLGFGRRIVPRPLGQARDRLRPRSTRRSWIASSWSFR